MSSDVRVLSQDDVTALLSMRECIEVVEQTLAMAARGESINPLRTFLILPERRGILGMMPAYLESPRCTGIKVVTVMPGNHGTPYDSHQGAVLLFEAEHGRLLAIMDASAITAIRTAAASGLATRLLSREDATSLALIGSGVQARTHLEAIRLVRPISQVHVWSRSLANAEAFAAAAAEKHNIDVTAVPSVEQALQGADIVCTTTASREPLVNGAWLTPGMHINAVGACVRTHRELDTEAIARSRLFVDWRESAVNESGDYLMPLAEGAIGPTHIRGEIGEVLIGRVGGRASPDEITIFDSLGIGLEDLGPAWFVYDKALQTGAGVTMEFGGRQT